MALYYNYLTKTDHTYLAILSNPEIINIYGLDTTWNEVSVISIEYGGKTIAMAKVNKGEWISLKYHTKWSQKSDGFIQSWVNNKNFTDGVVSGSNMLNKASHYFKFGLYRNPNIPFTNSIYYDNLVIY